MSNLQVRQLPQMEADPTKPHRQETAWLVAQPGLQSVASWKDHGLQNMDWKASSGWLCGLFLGPAVGVKPVSNHRGGTNQLTSVELQPVYSPAGLQVNHHKRFAGSFPCLNRKNSSKCWGFIPGTEKAQKCGKKDQSISYHFTVLPCLTMSYLVSACLRLSPLVS